MFKKVIILAAFVVAFSSSVNVGSVRAAGGAQIYSQDWTTNGLFGFFDRKQLKRGFQVYSEICASCHSVRLLFYRNLEEIGFSPEEVKKIAAEA